MGRAKWALFEGESEPSLHHRTQQWGWSPATRPGLSSMCEDGVVAPMVRYARRGDLHVAYAVIGDGPIDVVFVPGFVSNLSRTLDPQGWPTVAAWLERVTRFARVITFDKIGTGLSDRSTDIPGLEDRMDDVRAVMDAAGSERAALVGISEGGPMSILFAATFPERVHSLTLY